jgi:hypothetical protein
MEVLSFIEMIFSLIENGTNLFICQEPLLKRLYNQQTNYSQKRWLQKPENQDYFRGSQNVQRVQRWRKANPGYWRRKPQDKPPRYKRRGIKY